MADNPGTSVTNAVELIATQLHRTRLIDIPPETIRWIEHYTPLSYKQRNNNKETFDQVSLIWDETSRRFHSPSWRPCDAQTLKILKKLH